MAKLPSLSGPQISRVLVHNNMPAHRCTRHGILHFHVTDRTRRALVPQHDVVAVGTLRTIIRDSKKDPEEFRGA